MFTLGRYVMQQLSYIVLLVYLIDGAIAACTRDHVYCKSCSGAASEAACKADTTPLVECTQTNPICQRQSMSYYQQSDVARYDSECTSTGVCIPGTFSTNTETLTITCEDFDKCMYATDTTVQGYDDTSTLTKHLERTTKRDTTEVTTVNEVSTDNTGLAVGLALGALALLIAGFIGGKLCWNKGMCCNCFKDLVAKLCNRNRGAPEVVPEDAPEIAPVNSQPPPPNTVFPAV